MTSLADDRRLEVLLGRISAICTTEPGKGSPPPAATAEQADDKQSAPDQFVPIEPASLEKAGLSDGQLEGLILKMLLARGECSGRDIAEQIRLPFGLLDEFLRRIKGERLVAHRAAAPMNDLVYEVTDLGRERARRHAQQCTYFGAAPVSLRDYVAAITAQSVTRQQHTAESLRRAFQELVLNPKMLDKLGPAINSGRGLFLYGAPGNGKTSIAERVTAVFGEHIWIPRALGVDGEIIRVYDPMCHIEVPPPANEDLLEKAHVDKRWARIRRPTIIAGGELTMESLEVTFSDVTGIGEAPLQMKSNCGTLVIDDFGRQKVALEELLNRWIVPLERQYDFLNLRNGKKIQVPFDQLLVFSSNIEPRSLVDEAFLRRVPYKIQVLGPTEEEFRRLVGDMAARLGFAFHQGPVDYLVEKHYRQAGREFRFCHPRDLLQQMRNFCAYHGRPFELTNEGIDTACQDYFGVMDGAAPEK